MRWGRDLGGRLACGLGWHQWETAEERVPVTVGAYRRAIVLAGMGAVLESGGEGLGWVRARFVVCRRPRCGRVGPPSGARR